jgi:hypothetical protein
MNLKSVYKGFWWTPEKPEEKMPGELEVDSSGTLVLTLVLERDNLHSNVESRNYSIPVITDTQEIGGQVRIWHSPFLTMQYQAGIKVG